MVDIEIPIQIQYFYLDESNWLWISILQLLIKVKNIPSASSKIDYQHLRVVLVFVI